MCRMWKTYVLTSDYLVRYNLDMQKPITQRQKELLEVIYTHIRDTGYPPTFEEMRENLGVSSNQSVIDLLEKLKRNQTGMLRVLG